MGIICTSKFIEVTYETIAQKVKKQTRLNLPGGQTLMQPSSQPVSLLTFNS